MHRKLLGVFAFALTAFIAIVVIDAIQRAATLSTWTRGIGTSDNPSRDEERTAEWNLLYLIGLAAGTASTTAAFVATRLWRRPLRGRMTSSGDEAKYQRARIRNIDA